MSNKISHTELFRALRDLDADVTTVEITTSTGYTLTITSDAVQVLDYTKPKYIPKQGTYFCPVFTGYEGQRSSVFEAAIYYHNAVVARMRSKPDGEL